MMDAKITTKLVLTVMGFDLLGIVAATALCLYLRGTVFEVAIWIPTFILFVFLGTGLGVWQVMKQLQQ